MSFTSTLLLALSATSVLAQTQITWGSVVFAMHGEKTPFLAPGLHHLTPLGATQLQNAGTIVRERYIQIRNGTNSTRRFFPINGLSTTNIVNSQLDTLTLDDEVMAASAMAFMQGLYPPRPGYENRGEEYTNVQSYNGIGSLLKYPLDGYQYPAIRTVNTASDFDSIWIAGNIGCDKYSVSEVVYKTSPAYTNQVTSTLDFYQGLRRTVFQYVSSVASAIDYRSAEQLYEYALYEYNHNYSMSGYRSKFTPRELSTLRNLASEQQFSLNRPMASPLGNISSIAGQTLAGLVFKQFGHIMNSNSYTNKLSLMFTSYEPFLAFFALSDLSYGASASRFQNLPQHGSIMAFELFSYSNSTNLTLSRPFPPQSELYVRFLFRNGTDTEELTAYPLFRDSPSTSMTWYEFVNQMDKFAVQDVDEWCNVCATQNVFCRQLQNTPITSGQSNSNNSNKGLSPIVSGIVGALVALALAAIVFVALVLLGFRLQRKDQKPKASRSDLGVLRMSSGNGGYKGAEKLASDTDLRLKGGAGATVVRHERVGSWELNDGAKGPAPVYPSLDKDLESGRVRSHVDYSRRSADYEDLERVNPFGDPIRPTDHI